MSLKIFLITLTAIIKYVFTVDIGEIEITGIEPNSGPVYGETRVTVRLKNFDKNLIDDYDRPKCRFGSNQRIVNATYVACSPKPREVGAKEPTKAEKNNTCIICEISPPHQVDIVPFTVSLIGDFTDIKNSVQFRYYDEPIIDYVYPRYGPKDGGTFIEIYGKNFLNMDQNLRCGFGSRESKGFYVTNEYMICYSPPSDIVQKELPFSVSLNNQQNTKQNIDFVYFEFPQVFRLEPNKGPDTGGTVVHIRGQNFDPTYILSMSNHNDTFCKFGNLSLTNSEVISSTEMVCVSPPSYEEREVPVEITLNNREWTSDDVLFYYYHPPFIYSIEPRIGPVSGGTVVRIIGSNFENTGFVMCKFGSIYVKGEYMDQNELRCIAPPVEKPGYVNLFVAIRPDEFSSGLNTRYLYYDTPIIDRIEPMCGPEKGYTQITVYGKNFANTGSDYVKCVFDKNIKTNATVYSDTEIKCDSPSVLNGMGINEKNITQYDVEITLNDNDLNGPTQIFYYYKDTFTTSLDPIFGPRSGNTTVNITGLDFTQPGVCNVTLRVATYHIKPDIVEKGWMTFKTPQVNFTGATVVQIALNGRQFDKDNKVQNRDKENTFYYYKQPLIRNLSPRKGPTIGGTELTLFGIGFDDTFYEINNIEDRKIYYKFIDVNDQSIQYGDIYTTTVYDSHMINVVTPRVYQEGLKAFIYLSYNKNDENFRNANEKLIFTYYLLPNVTGLNPLYGPLKTENQNVEIYLDNYYCTDNCDAIYCRFKSKNNVFVQKGTYARPNTLNCIAPNVNIPDVYNVEVSFNGDDYTNNGYNYTFYDPYVIRVVPQMVSSKGGTKLDIYGFGFANSGENLKAQFGDPLNRLRCEGHSCIVQAEYVSSELIRAVTYPQRDVSEALNGESIGFKKFAVEASVYNNDFTVNNVTIFYYDEPEIINDIYSFPMNATDREIIANSLLQNLPANLDTVIIIPIDSSKINKYYEQFNEYANYTCKFTMEVEPYDYKITKGMITSFPLESELNNIYLCQSPIWEKAGKANVTISLNGYDYSETKYDILFTDPIKIHSIQPPCGPRKGNTKIRIIGSGFQHTPEYLFKFGVQNSVLMNETKVIKKYSGNELLESKKISSEFVLEEIELLSPEAPFRHQTLGGPDYLSYSKKSYFPLEDYVSKYFTNNFIHNNFEFYYYHQPYVQSISPHGSIVNGGTDVLVVGAWFDLQEEYGVKPYCKFGNKIVQGEFLSTVRIKCKAPQYDTPNVRVPFEVSLNGVDWTDSNLLFTFYNDYTKAKFERYEPTSGPDTGGTNIKIFGESFTSLLNPEEFLCRFNPLNKNLEPKKVPAGYKDFGNNQTAIICNTPGGWASGSVADIQITFDGQNFIDTGFDFYFYKIEYLNPSSGPTTGNGPIQVMGSGFQNSTKVKCMLNDIEMKPIDVYPDRILCPMTKSPFGLNFTGAVDFGVSLNGIDWKIFNNGFYYYVQPIISDIFPQYGPSKGNAIIKVFGDGFRSDFAGTNPGCRVGRHYGLGKVVNENEIDCTVSSMPLLPFNQTLNVTIALNNYSFVEEVSHLNFTPYGVSNIEPSSGPVQGNTRIEIRGAGFFEGSSIRCRFGVPGWYGYTEGVYVDYNRIICLSPPDFVLPQGGKYPFSVPFSVAFNEDEFSKFFYLF